MKGKVPDVAAAAEAFEWPPVPVLRSMFYDGYDVWVAELLGVDRNIVAHKRKELGIPEFRQKSTKAERIEQRSVYTRKWAGLLRRGQAPAAAGDGTDSAPGRPPVSLDELVSEIKAYLDDEGRRPDVERLARRLGRPAAEIREAFGELVRAGMARWDAGLMTLLDHGQAVRPDTLPPAPIHIPPRPVDRPVLLKPTTDPAEEVQDDMPMKVDREKDLALVKEYDDLANSGAKQLYKTLADRHGISTATYSARLSAARHRLEAHKNGHDVYGTGPMQRISFRCEACRDSGRVVGIGTYCECEIGQRLKASENPIAPQPQAATVAPQDSGQGDHTPEQPNAVTTVTASETGSGVTLPDPNKLAAEIVAARWLDTQVGGISTTTPTGEQLPAIIEGLTGGTPTSEELEALLAEPAQPGQAEGNLPPFHVTPDQETEILRSRVSELEAELKERTTSLQAVFQVRDTLQANVAELEASLRAKEALLETARDAEAGLLTANQNLAAELQEAKANVADLTATIERAARASFSPVVLELNGGALRPLAGLIGPDVQKIGDQFVQPVTVDGHHLYNIYTLALMGADENGRPVRVLTLVHDAAMKGAA